MSRRVSARMVPFSIGISYDLPVRLSTMLRLSLPEGRGFTATPAAAESFVLVPWVSVERDMRGGLRRLNPRLRILQDNAPGDGDQRPADEDPRRIILISRRMSRGRGDSNAIGRRLTGWMKRSWRACRAVRAIRGDRRP